MSFGELACTYAALILHNDGIPVTAEKIATLVKSENVNVESYCPSLFAILCEKRNIEDLIMNVGARSGAGVAAVAVTSPVASGGASATAAVPAAEEEKEEPKEESDDEMGFSLFD